MGWNRAGLVANARGLQAVTYLPSSSEKAEIIHNEIAGGRPPATPSGEQLPRYAEGDVLPLFSAEEVQKHCKADAGGICE
jgi:hypothetical protein